MSDSTEKGVSVIHDWDVRFKLLVFTIYIAAVTLSYGYTPLLTGTLGAAAMVILSKTGIKDLLRFLKTPFILLVMIAPLIVFSSKGEVLYRYGLITIYREGVILTTVIFLRIITIVTMIFIIINTESRSSIFYGVRFFRVPVKLIAIFAMTYRYIFLYHQRLLNMRNASVLRGGNTVKMLYNLKNCTGMAFTLILRGYEQSERVNDAMCMRGFSGRFHSMEEPEVNLIRDLSLFVLFLVFPVAMIAAEYCVW